MQTGPSDRVDPSPWPGILTTAVAALTPLVAYLGNLGFAPLVALAGLLYLPRLWRDRPASAGYALLLALALWALVSMLWSGAFGRSIDLKQYEGFEAYTGIKLALQLGLYGTFVLAALSLTPEAGGRASRVLAFGLLAVSLLFVVEAVLKAPLYQWIRRASGQETNLGWAMRDVARVAYVLALLFWPATLALTRMRLAPAAAVLALFVIVGAYLLNADAPLAALAVASLVFAAVWFLGRRAILAWGVGVIVYFTAAPLVIHALGPGQLIQVAPGDIRVLSWEIRLDIWRFATARILERPFFGWGLDASRTFAPQIPLHTHDAALQIWLELGAVGAALAALFWLWLARRIDTLEAENRGVAAASAACASAYLTIGALSFGVWQEWWLALGALGIASCAALAAASRTAPSQPEQTPPALP
jgi:O-antigen ligase